MAKSNVDGSLIFETKIDLDGYKKSLSELESLSKTGIQIAAKATLDKSDFENNFRELERHTEDIEPVIVETEVDDKGLKEGIAKLDDVAQNELQRLDSPIDNGKLTVDTRVENNVAADVAKGILGSNFLQAGLEKMVEIGRQGIQLASDLEEVQNVVDVTFGQEAAQIEAFANAASASFGLTELQAKQFSGTIGAMVKSMDLTEREALDMSTSLVGLAGDMASFYNLDHETAFEKIRSGIAGETEPLKQLGINMSVANLEAYALSKGIKRAYEDMSEAEKVQLRYGYIMQQTTDAQGDFVRTQDGYANQVRMLQNNLDTMAANIGAMLIPALTKATGWLNDLFDGPDTNETQTAIDNAVSSLSTLDSNIQEIKKTHAKEAIKIQIDYTSASGLLDDYEALKGISGETEGASEDMAEIVQQLLALYPRLEAYVDPETGLLSAEVEQVRNLIDGYKDLSLYKLMAARSEQIGGEFLDAVVDIKLLEQEAIAAREELDKLTERRDNMKSAYAGIRGLHVGLAPGEMPDLRNATEAINAYIYSMGGLSEEVLKDLDYNGVRWYDLFGGDGLLKHPEEIEKTIGGIEALRELLAAIEYHGSGEQYALDDEIAAAEKALQTATTAITEYLPEFNDVVSDYQTSMDALNTFAAETGLNAGAALGEEATAALKAQKDEMVGAVEYIGDSLQKTADRLGITFPVGFRYYGVGNPQYPGHATGLDYVPYDNYLARLHVGEAVLTASEAQKWRNRNDGIDYEALAAAIRDTSASDVPARPIVLQIDGKTFAEAMADKNLTAISARERRINMGVGR